MRVLFSGLLAAVTVVGAGQASAADDPSGWLLKVSDAARQANYQGVVIYRDARTMEVMRVVHRQHGGRIQERLTSLTGKPRDILRQGDEVACLVADEPVQASGGIPQSLFPVMSQAVLAQASQHYELRDLGKARVAGRACHGVALAPRDDFRYGYEICADEATAVPLRVRLMDRAGREVEQLMFTEVAFPSSIDEAAFALPAGAAGYSAARDGATQATADGGSADWQLAKLPPGFRVVMHSQKPAPGGQGIVEQVLLSDGLSAVSVFGVRTAAETMFQGVSQIGAMNAYGRHVGGYHVTVVGEVPEKTVRLIGDGLTPNPPR
jgi:sigma-E factor negative regulatory protein RseB